MENVKRKPLSEEVIKTWLGMHAVSICYNILLMFAAEKGKVFPGDRKIGIN